MPKTLSIVSQNKDLERLIGEISQSVFRCSNEENDSIVRRILLDICRRENALATLQRISESTTRERISSTGSRRSDSSNDESTSTMKRCFGCGESFGSCFCQKCEFCAGPVAVMGQRRHHCRRCGATLCSKCWIRRTDDGLWKVCRFSDACDYRLLESRSKKSDDALTCTTRTVSTSRRYKWKRFLTSNTTTSEIASKKTNHHHITRISVLPKEKDIEKELEKEQRGVPTREQQNLANRMSKLVGAADSSHLAMALLRDDDKKVEKVLGNTSHIRGISIFHEIGKKTEEAEESSVVFDARHLATPSPIQTSRRHQRQQSSHLDDVLTSTLMTKGEEDFSKCLYGDGEDDCSAGGGVIVSSPTILSSSPPNFVPELCVGVSLLDDEEEGGSPKQNARGSPGRVRGVSIFDDIDMQASELSSYKGDSRDGNNAQPGAVLEKSPGSPSLWRRLRAIGSHSPT